MAAAGADHTVLLRSDGQAVAFGLVPMGFTTASAMAEQQVARIMIGTGCQELDNILEGGLESGSITEVYGEYRCGKTQTPGTGH